MINLIEEFKLLRELEEAKDEQANRMIEWLLKKAADKQRERISDYLLKKYDSNLRGLLEFAKKLSQNL